VLLSQLDTGRHSANEPPRAREIERERNWPAKEHRDDLSANFHSSSFIIVALSTMIPWVQQMEPSLASSRGERMKQPASQTDEQRVRVTKWRSCHCLCFQCSSLCWSTGLELERACQRAARRLCAWSPPVERASKEPLSVAPVRHSPAACRIVQHRQAPSSNCCPASPIDTGHHCDQFAGIAATTRAHRSSQRPEQRPASGRAWLGKVQKCCGLAALLCWRAGQREGAAQRALCARRCPLCCLLGAPTTLVGGRARPTSARGE